MYIAQAYDSSTQLPIALITEPGHFMHVFGHASCIDGWLHIFELPIDAHCGYLSTHRLTCVVNEHFPHELGHFVTISA